MVQQALYRPGVSVGPPPASVSANLVRIQKQSIRGNTTKQNTSSDELYDQSRGHWQHSSRPQQPVQPQRPQMT
jgi:hypothetical protein